MDSGAPDEPTVAEPGLCPRCGGPLVARVVKTTFWTASGVVVIVEDIPAHVCDACVDQFYDVRVSDALRRLAEEGFPADQAASQLTVWVFTLSGRIRESSIPPEDVFLD